MPAETTEPYYQVAHKADREDDPERKRRILEMAAKLRAEQGGNDDVDDEDLAVKIAYIRPVRDSLLVWAELQPGFKHIQLNAFQDGSASLEMDVADRECSGARVVIRFNVTIEG